MDENRLRLELDWDGQHIVAVRMAEQRLFAATALLGCEPIEVAQRIPRLFPLCRAAQQAASAAALETALSEVPSDTKRHAWAQRVALEAAGDHLQRLLISWPEELGSAPHSAELQAWRKRLATADSLGIANELGPILLGWSKTLSTPRFAENPPPDHAPLLPYFDAAMLALGLEHLTEADDASFSAQPHWQGIAGEVGPLARHALHPEVATYLSEGRRIAARHAACRVDLADLARGLTVPERLPTLVDVVRIGESGALARVDTARGMLIHRVTLTAGRVSRYLIVAPTEWNFHPAGPFTRELQGRPANSREEVLRTARLLALALDPCLAYEVVVNSPHPG
jgi:hypothetical protein